MQRGEGAIVEDVDGNRFLDFAAVSLSSLPVILTLPSSQPSRNRLPNSSTCRAPISITKAWSPSLEKLAALTPGNRQAARLFRQFRR